MAIFATAALVKAQAKLIGAFQANELRFREPAVHKLFLENSTIMFPDYNELRTREDRTVETNYVTRTSRALGSGRSHNHTGAQGDSALMTPSWSTYHDDFVSTIKEADNKIYSLEEMHMSKLQNVVANFAEGLEAVAAAYLFANRSGVNVATVEGTFDAVDDTFEITESTNGERAVQITKMVMDLNGYKGNYTIVCDSIAWNKFGFQEAQGSSNDTNTSFQFSPNVRFVHDATLAASAAGLVSAYAKGYWICVPDGTIGALPWIPRQNRMGADHGQVARFGTIMNPIDGLNYALHTYEEGVDGTGTGGYTQDVKIETEISIDISYVHAPSSTATDSSLMAFALV
jgi:hypothetical protein